MNPRSLLLLILPFLLIQGALRASTEEAEKRLKASVDKVVAVAKSAPDRKALIAGVKPVLENILSFDAMTRRAVGPGWRQFTPEQQKEAIGLFTTLILRTYTAKFTPGELPAVEYKTASSTAPNRVEIPTTLLYKGSRYDVIYRLEETDGAPWRITDVVIEGVSMVANYRTQFDSQFKQGGADAVITALNRSVSESK
ncbi:MAG: ABC transporter substrate-binding protein [Chthoniobacterales bacterium]|jgi:phospholipid transport system substrate-binding protein